LDWVQRWRRRHCIPPKSWYPPKRLSDATTQKFTIYNFYFLYAYICIWMKVGLPWSYSQFTEVVQVAERSPWHSEQAIVSEDAATKQRTQIKRWCIGPHFENIYSPEFILVIFKNEAGRTI
jgi:NDP-sugar pyrophosphorylase family protein